ncbi:MAG TPA: hypothetical protein VFH66_04435 [Mycobacteriales bacterium]|nr:hypothetical protein [Mycobacteriales bacterium]
MPRVLRLLASAGCAAALVVALPAGAAPAKSKSYGAPFKLGPSGGDSFSYHSATSDGTVTVGRIYPIPGVINCTKGAPYAKLLVVFRATRAVHKVVATYDSAAVDPFTFVQLGLRDTAKGNHHWYGLKTVRGAVTGSGTVGLRPYMPEGPFPKTLVVEFGLQQSSACPNADVGTIHFSKIEVS